MTLFSNRWYRSSLLLFFVLFAFFGSIGHAQSETNSEFKNEPSLTKEDEMINADEIYIELHPDNFGDFDSCYKDARQIKINTKKEFDLLFNLINIKNHKKIQNNFDENKILGKKVYIEIAFFKNDKGIKLMDFIENENDMNSTHIFTYDYSFHPVKKIVLEVKKNPKILYEEIYKAFDFKTKGKHPCYL
jgi:hypothetical protein